MKNITSNNSFSRCRRELYITGCGGNCTANLQCTNYGCTNMIYYVDSDGHTRVAYTMGFGSQAIISNCQSITSIAVVDPSCCLGMVIAGLEHSKSLRLLKRKLDSKQGIDGNESQRCAVLAMTQIKRGVEPARTVRRLTT